MHFLTLMHLSIITVDVSNEDDDCMTISMLFDPFSVVVGKQTGKKLSHDNKIQNKKVTDCIRTFYIQT